MAGARRTRSPHPRHRHLYLHRHLCRALGLEHNDLARAVDRARSRALVLAALAVGLAALLGAGIAWAELASTARRAAQSAPHLHRVDAVLLGPARAATGAADPQAGRYRADAEWTDPSGQRHTGEVGLDRSAPSGSTTGIWVGDAGRPAAAPPSTADLVSDAVSLGLSGCVGMLTLVGCGLGLRLTRLNHRTDAAWQRSWSAVEPVWTGRAAREPGNGDPRRG
ncbi:Rv1733c family protein [Kitasatospora cinereorecta]|uniref:Rv1733c family protein n=1 Tax=Kitasatospora cinereorecta TaxID=285560 RepID=UPI0031F77659